MKQIKRENATLHLENRRLMIVSADKMRKQLDAERKLSGVMSHVLGGFDMWLPRIDDRTRAEIERVREKIEGIVNG